LGRTALRPWLYFALTIASLSGIALMLAGVPNPLGRRPQDVSPEAIQFWVSHGNLYSDGLQALAEVRNTVNLAEACVQGKALPDRDCAELAVRLQGQGDRLAALVSAAQALEAPSTDKTIQAWLDAIIAERGEDARIVRRLSYLVQPGVGKADWGRVVAELDTQPHRGAVERATDRMLNRVINIQNTGPSR